MTVTDSPRTASVPADLPDAMERLARDLGPGPFAHLCLFVSPGADLAALCGRAAQLFPRATICGCTTAGEITAQGYDEGQAVAFALPAGGFETEVLVFERIDRLDARQVVADLLRARQALSLRAAHLPHECAVLLVDGLSGQEDGLVAALSGALGAVPMAGGSAADGGQFRRTLLYAHGRVMENAAALVLIRSRGAVRPFSLDNLNPTPVCMVVTEADPARRIVSRINDEPAAREYARLMGVAPDLLSPFVFAAHPVMVRAGGRHHARAVQGVQADGSLLFFSAVAEGLVLTLAAPGNMADHLQQELTALARNGAPSAILGFDCLFRKIDAQGRQQVRDISDILARHRVSGFSTYGEQIGAMHVNQTLTGFAFYPPGVVP
ncbi:FIST N-terminal domain-containing protein [Paenirhodobacter sp.]|uniref:FIST N-terminal domain-containing protein n=1 Tax=Paenirhodobacter sp. TaxID=1965326 RepID=UPI003B41F23D